MSSDGYEYDDPTLILDDASGILLENDVDTHTHNKGDWDWDWDDHPIPRGESSTESPRESTDTHHMQKVQANHVLQDTRQYLNTVQVAHSAPVRAALSTWDHASDTTSVPLLAPPHTPETPLSNQKTSVDNARGHAEESTSIAARMARSHSVTSLEESGKRFMDPDFRRGSPLFAGVSPFGPSGQWSKLHSEPDFSKHTYTRLKPLIGMPMGVVKQLDRNPGSHSFAGTTRTVSLDEVTTLGSFEYLEEMSPWKIIQEGRESFSRFLRNCTCYDMIPNSGKLVVFETRLLVKKAFFALVQHGLRSALLWDTTNQQFVGMITITDFITFLRKYYVSPLQTMQHVEEDRIEEWSTECAKQKRNSLAGGGSSPSILLSIDPMASVFDAARMLLDEKIHRLPVIDSRSGNALNIITHKRILLFLLTNFEETPQVLKMTIGQLNLGTKRDIATILHETPLITALNLFVERRISALPILNADGAVVDIYAKYDAINLARDRTYNNLDVTVSEALKHRTDFEGVLTCKLDDSLGMIMGKIVKAHVHRLVIVNDQQHLLGILSLSDILSFLLTQNEP